MPASDPTNFAQLMLLASWQSSLRQADHDLFLSKFGLERQPLNAVFWSSSYPRLFLLSAPLLLFPAQLLQGTK